MSDVLKEVVDCGLQDNQYRMAIAMVSQRLLSDVTRAPLTIETALVVPAMKSPFPRLLSRRMPFHTIYVLDPDEENIRWQAANIEAKEKCTFLVGDESNAPDLKGVGFVLNPFGLQHYAEQSKYFGEKVRALAHSAALLATLDWGITTYPEDMKDFPGISNEIQHSELLQLRAFGIRDGWELVKEMEFKFFVRHTVHEIAMLLTSDHSRQLREEFVPDRNVEVGSSILYRLYEAR